MHLIIPFDLRGLVIYFGFNCGPRCFSTHGTIQDSILHLITEVNGLEELTWERNYDKTSHFYDNNKDMYIK